MSFENITVYTQQCGSCVILSTAAHRLQPGHHTYKQTALVQMQPSQGIKSTYSSTYKPCVGIHQGTARQLRSSMRPSAETAAFPIIRLHAKHPRP